MPDLKEDLTHRSTADSRAAKLIFCSRFLSRGRTFFALPRRPPRVPFARDGVLEVYRLSSELQSLSVQRDLLKRSIRNNLFRWLFKNPVSFFYILARQPFIFQDATLEKKLILTGTEIVLLRSRTAEKYSIKWIFFLRCKFFFSLPQKNVTPLCWWRRCGVIKCSRTAAQWPMLWIKNGKPRLSDYHSQFKTWSVFLKRFAPRESWINRKLTSNSSDKEWIHNWALVEDKFASFGFSHVGTAVLCFLCAHFPKSSLIRLDFSAAKFIHVFGMT